MDRFIGLLKLIAGSIVAALSIFILLACLGNVLFFLAMLFGEGTAVGEKTYRDVICCISASVIACLVAWVFISVLRASREWRRDGWSTVRGHWRTFSEEKTRRTIEDFHNKVSGGESNQ